MAVIHLEAFVAQYTSALLALVPFSPQDLAFDGLLSKPVLARVLAETLSGVERDFDGVSLHYLDDNGLPMYSEFVEFHLPKGSSCRELVHLADGTQMYRSQKCLAQAYKLINL